MKKRMIYVCSLGLLSAAVFNAGMKYDGTLLVYAQENREENIIGGDSGQEWELSGLSEDTGISNVSGLQEQFELGDGDAAGLETEGVSQIMFCLDGEVIAVPLDQIVQIRAGEAISLKQYGNLYVSFFAPEDVVNNILHFSQPIDAGDLRFYSYDAVNQTVKEQLGEDRVCMTSEGVFSICTDGLTECLVVLEHAEKYPQVEVNISTVEPEETVPEVEANSATDPVTEPETGADVKDEAKEKADTVQEPESEAQPGAEVKEEADIVQSAESEVKSEDESTSESKEGYFSDQTVEPEEKDGSESVTSSDSKDKSEPENKSDSMDKSDSEDESTEGPDADSTTDSITQSKADSSETNTDSTTDSAPESDTNPEANSDPATDADGKTETDSDADAKTETDSEADAKTETDSEADAKTETDPETDPVTETDPEAETDSTPAADEESSVRLESAQLVLTDGLELLPAAMLPYLDLEETAKVLLQYSDGSQQLLTGESDTYGNTVLLTYEDASQEDGSVIRTYCLKVAPALAQDEGLEEQTQTVVFQKQVGENIDDIKAQEKTKVGFSREKNWLLVQSVPQVTGKYSLESFGRELEDLYYLADGQEEAVKVDGAFELTEGVTYTFLLKLAS